MEEAKHSRIEILRRKIKKMVDENMSEGDLLLNESDAMKFIHEIEVQQCELELQNEELIVASVKETIAARKYADLYDFAPSGYFTISSGGIITEINFSGASMLGKERSALINSQFGFFLSNDTRADFNLFLSEIFISKEKKTCDLNLSDHWGVPMYVCMTGIADPNGEQCYLTAIDFTERKRMEEELRISKDKYKAIFEHSVVGKSMTSVTDGKMKVNKAFCEILGYSETEFSALNWQTITHPDDQEQDLEMINSLISGEKETARWEKRYVHKDGKTIWVDISTSIQYDRENKPLFLNTSIIDISDRKQAQKELQKSEERYRSLMTSLEAGIVVHAPDTSIIMNNPRASELLGLIGEQIKGRVAIDPGWKFIFQDGTPLRLEEYPVNRVIESGKSISNLILGVVHSAGNPVVWLTVNGIPAFDDRGELSEIIISFIDITERKLAEQELLLGNKVLFRQNEEMIKRAAEMTSINQELREKDVQYRNLANSGPALIWTSGTDKLCNYFNNTWLRFTGRTLEQEIGNGWAEGVHADDFDSCLETYVTAFDHREPFEMEYRLMHISGEYRWILDLGTPNYNLNGEFIGYIGNCFDITERKGIEQELLAAKDHAVQSDRLKSAFLANMSHEIRTPMNGILGFAELLKEPDLSGEQQQDYIRIIEKSGERMLNIINDIIDISKIESEQMKVSISVTNVNEKIEYLHTFFKPETNKKGIEFHFKNGLPERKARILTDPEKIYAILTNLVKNAIKFCVKGTIEIGYDLVETHDSAPLPNSRMSLQFYVKDTGMGIPKDRQEAIFERFIQVDILDKMARQGAGLGLSISKAYVEMLGGQIWVESEPGEGSTFYFTLPYIAVPIDEILDTSFISVKEAINLIRKLKILIAEDDEISEKLMEREVKRFSKRVFKARTGYEAVEVCMCNPDIDLVLMDIKMPGMDGYEATRQIRQFNKDVVIIAQTAFAFIGDREMALKVGCNDYLPKPIRNGKLLEVMQKYFNTE